MCQAARTAWGKARRGERHRAEQRRDRLLMPWQLCALLMSLRVCMRADGAASWAILTTLRGGSKAVLAEGSSINEVAAQGVRYTMVRGPVMCEHIRVLVCGCGCGCGCRCDMRGSERFVEMRICRVELSCGAGLRVRCDVMQCTARVFGSQVS